MDDRALQALKNMENLLEELKSVSNLLERVVKSNENIEKSLADMREIYDSAVKRSQR